MAIAFVGAYSSQLGSANSPIATYQFVAPAGTPVGALMLAFVSVTGTTPPQIPDGWTYLASYSQYDYINASVSVFSRVFAAGDTTWPCYMFGQSGYGAVVIGAWTGVALLTGASASPLTYQTAPEGPLKTGDVIPMVWANSLTGQSGAITWPTPAGASQRATVPASKASGGDTIHTLALADGLSGGDGGTSPGGSSTSQSAAGGQGNLLGTMTALLRASLSPNVPVLTSPASGASVNLTGAPTFTWAYVATRPGNSQTRYAFRRKVISGSYEWWNGASWQSAEVFLAATVSSLTFPAAKWNAGNSYVWSVATQDADGAGPYAADQVLSSFGPVAPLSVTGVYDAAQARTAITVTRLPDNLLSANTAGLETDASGWVATYNASPARSTSYAREGAASLRFALGGGGPDTAEVGTVAGVTVTPGVTYTAMAALMSGSAARNFYLQFHWYDTSGTEIGYAQSGDVGEYGGTFLEARFQAVAPAGAATAKLRVGVKLVASPTEYHYLDTAGVYPGSYLASWTPGGLSSRSVSVVAQAATNNLLDANTASVESDASGWVATYNAGQPVRSTAYARDGLSSLAFGLGGGPPDTAEIGTSADYPCSAGSTYTAVAALFAGSAARQFYLQFHWYDVAGAEVSYAQSATVGEYGGGWIEGRLTAVAPARAVTMKMRVGVNGVASLSELHYLDTAGIFLGAFAAPWVSPAKNLSYQVRGMSPMPSGGSGPSLSATGYDYEATPQGSFLYYAVTTAVNGAGTAFLSPPAASAPVLVTPNSWWLKDPLAPGNNLPVNPQAPSVKQRLTERSASFAPLGRSKPVVVSDSVSGEAGSATWRTFTAADYQALKVLLRRQATLLLQSPFGEQWFCRLMADRQWDLLVSTLAQPVRDTAITWEEVDRPLVSG